MKKTKTTMVTLELTQAEYDHIWDCLYALNEYPRTLHQNEYLNHADIAFAKKFVEAGPPSETEQ